MHRNIIILVIGLFSFQVPSSGWGESRTIAVLEYRAAVRAASEVANGMAEELTQLTSNTVISPDEARRLLGPGLDAEVARCKGNTGCISAIGKRLKCDEIILVGLSQLGDLILAIQRIEVASQQVLSRMADSLHPKQHLRSATLRSYLQRLLPPSDFKRYGHIQIKTDAQGDDVFVDEVFRGKTPLSPLKVPAPGRYAVRVSRQGYEDFLARLDILPEANVEVTPTLTPKSPPPMWYQHWWVWALVGTAAAAVTTGVVAGSLTQEPDSVKAVIHLNP